jgi:hypothetical protein
VGVRALNNSSVREILKVVRFDGNFKGPREFQVLGKEYRGNLLKTSRCTVGIVNSLKFRSCWERARFAFFGQTFEKEARQYPYSTECIKSALWSFRMSGNGMDSNPIYICNGNRSALQKRCCREIDRLLFESFDCLQKDKTVLKCCSGTVLPSLHISSRFEIFSNSKTKVDYGGCVTP